VPSEPRCGRPLRMPGGGIPPRVAILKMECPAPSTLACGFSATYSGSFRATRLHFLGFVPRSALRGSLCTRSVSTSRASILGLPLPQPGKLEYFWCREISRVRSAPMVGFRGAKVPNQASLRKRGASVASFAYRPGHVVCCSVLCHVECLYLVLTRWWRSDSCFQ
jgi:hypothetical protein